MCEVEDHYKERKANMTDIYKCTHTQRCFCKINRNVTEGEWHLLRPEVVVLCGSTGFMDAFHEATRRLSLEGKIVLTVGFPKSDLSHLDNREAIESRLDELHLMRIELADRVLVLNVDGYIGESTAEEIAYAESLDKPIAYLEETESDYITKGHREDGQ